MPNPTAARPRQQRPLCGNNISAAARHPAAALQQERRAQQPPFRTDVPCHTQTVPDLNGPAGAIGPPDSEAVP